MFYKRTLRSVTAETHQNGRELFGLGQDILRHIHTEVFPLAQVSVQLPRLKDSLVNGAAVLRVKGHIHATE